MAVSFAQDIRPLFTDMDIAHTKNFGVSLDDFDYMRDPAHAQNVLNRVNSGSMPDGHVVVEEAVQGAAVHAGRAAVGQVGDMVHIAGRGGLVAAAGPPAVLVPQDHRAADRGRDLGGVADVQRQRRAGQPGAEQPGAQERGQPAGAGDQVDGRADDGVPEHLQGLGGGRPRSGRTGAVIRQAQVIAAGQVRDLAWVIGRACGLTRRTGPIRCLAGPVWQACALTRRAGPIGRRAGLLGRIRVRSGPAVRAVAGELQAQADQVIQGARVDLASDDRDDGGVAGDPADRLAVQPGCAVAASYRGGGAAGGPPDGHLADPLLGQH
jgi:hypothetical protein